MTSGQHDRARREPYGVRETDRQTAEEGKLRTYYYNTTMGEIYNKKPAEILDMGSLDSRTSESSVCDVVQSGTNETGRDEPGLVKTNILSQGSKRRNASNQAWHQEVCMQNLSIG